MAEMGLAPKIFARRCTLTDTPLNCILLQFVIIGLLVSLDFNQILCIDNFFSASAATLEFCACIKLRYSQPHLERPYKIPVGDRLLVGVLLVPIALALYICYATLAESMESMVVVCAGLAIGLVLYLPFLKAGRHEQMTVANLSRVASMATHNPVQGALLKRASRASYVRAHAAPPADRDTPVSSARASGAQLEHELESAVEDVAVD